MIWRKIQWLLVVMCVRNERVLVLCETLGNCRMIKKIEVLELLFWDSKLLSNLSGDVIDDGLSFRNFSFFF